MIKSTKTRYSKNFSYYSTDEMIGRSLELYGEYSQSELEFLLSMLNRNSVVYDVGANIGYHTTAFASTGARVYTFEPNPDNYKLLEQNVHGLERVWLFNCAVGDQPGQVFCDEFDPDIPGNFGSVQINQSAGIPVKLVALDTLKDHVIREFDFPPPDMIKIDVEGYEYNVLLGCENIIDKHQPMIYFEAHETNQFKEIYEFLKHRGYQLYWAQCNNYNPDNLQKNIINIFGNTACFNVIACPDFMPLISGLTEVTGPHDDWHRFER